MKILFALLAAVPLLAQSAEQLEFFEKNIRPVFVTKCSQCHGAKMQMSGLSLTSAAGFTKGSDRGPVVVERDAAQSPLFKAISYNDKIKMPPAGKLSAQEIDNVKAWIEMGAPWPKEAAPAVTDWQKNRLAEGRKQWAFQPVKEYAPPKVNDESWTKNPIDHFILAKLEEKKIKPAAPASKLTLLRRVTYDLVGLPPSTKEIDDFLADNSPNAYAKVVDRLLASPQYGERWGRLWLDVARYADSTGMDEDHIYPHAWRYRDYVVKAFNEDLPYNRFVMEQIAGDLLPPEKPGTVNERGIVATGFLALGPKPLAQQDRIKMIYDVVDEQIDTVSKAFMGITVACARCHDHKFDPILTKDYYSLASIFASTEDFRNLGRPGNVSFIYNAPLDPAAYAKYQAHKFEMYGKQVEMEQALNEDTTRRNGELRPKIAAFLTAAWKVNTKGMTVDAASQAEAVESKQVEKWSRWLKSVDEKARSGYLKKLLEATDANIAAVAQEYQKTYMESATKWDTTLEKWRERFAVEAVQDREPQPRPKLDADDHPFFVATTFDGGPMELADLPRVAELRAEWQTLVKSLPPEPAMASAVTEGINVDQHVFLHGDTGSPGEPVGKQFPMVLAGDSQQPVTKGSGRLELAKWLASPDHPLTARVMVNRIWQGHFGEGLVRTPNNWGKMGEPPTHPELLDYLAKQFVASGWSIKSLHRMILLSNTYQMSGRTTKEVHDADPSNRLLSRFSRVRMSVEQIRDSMLTFDGSIDLTIGGSLLPAAKVKRPKMDPDEMTRRTIYIPVRRGSVPTVLATFDYGDATTASDGRARTNVAPQALFMMNSRFVVERARGFAKRLLDDAALSDAQRIDKAYLMVLTRKPDATEIDFALSYIADLEKKLTDADAHLSAWQSFCHILMSTNEFIYLN
jgi:hypothetical protein